MAAAGEGFLGGIGLFLSEVKGPMTTYEGWDLKSLIFLASCNESES